MLWHWLNRPNWALLCIAATNEGKLWPLRAKGCYFPGVTFSLSIRSTNVQRLLRRESKGWDDHELLRWARRSLTTFSSRSNANLDRLTIFRSWSPFRSLLFNPYPIMRLASQDERRIQCSIMPSSRCILYRSADIMCLNVCTCVCSGVSGQTTKQIDLKLSVQSLGSMVFHWKMEVHFA